MRPARAGRARGRRRRQRRVQLFTGADATRLATDSLGDEGAAALDVSEPGGREQDDGLARQLEPGLLGLVQLLHRELLEACGYSNGSRSRYHGPRLAR